MICKVFGKDGKGLILAQERPDFGPNQYYSINGQWSFKQIDESHIRINYTKKILPFQFIGYYDYQGDTGNYNWQSRTHEISEQVENALTLFNAGKRINPRTCPNCQNTAWVDTESSICPT